LPNDRERKIRARLKTDFIRYAETCLKLRAKDGSVRPFVLNAAQRHIHAALEEQRRTTGRVRALILKGRQQGCSTYIAGRFYWKLTHTRGLGAFVLTHLETAAKGVMRIMQRLHDNCPVPVRPLGKETARGLSFPRLDSLCAIGTARSKGVGRAQTIQLFHGSEVAFWPDADTHVAGILQAVPDVNGTEIILESTSAGAAGAFHAMCRAAMAGETDYAFIFVPWFWQDEYKTVPPKNFTPTAEEAEFAAAYHLQPDQMYWRRRKITELGGIVTFRREYPATADEAFLADNPAALWSRAMIAQNRVCSAPTLKRTVIAVDPAVSAHGKSDETGIIVAGLGEDGHAYILADLSGRYTPAQWVSAVHKAYDAYEADRVVAEINQGGALVEHTLRTLDDRIAYKAVRASRGKTARAEPVAALDERGRVHHVGALPLLEDQMCMFDPGGPVPCDRVDARVWAVTELMLGRRSSGGPAVWG
jgi:hypothetical protein